MTTQNVNFHKAYFDGFSGQSAGCTNFTKLHQEKEKKKKCHYLLGRLGVKKFNRFTASSERRKWSNLQMATVGLAYKVPPSELYSQEVGD